MIDETAMLRDGSIAVSLYSDTVAVQAGKNYTLRVRSQEEQFFLGHNEETEIMGILFHTRSEPMFRVKGSSS